MVPPIPLGTLLRQRYRIQAILGQGGFGRTYLATDLERFDERCVLKEFSVPYQDETLVEKSQALFHREATTLYQIEHPQIPRFWAAFEEAQRLFLVQDFVDGHTYRHLLQERRKQGQAFSEAEVSYFLKKILPVLTYIHDRGIIHRDISPENIVLKPDSGPFTSSQSSLAETGLPVIIDFGAVKQATTHYPITSAITRVGKVGYAPPEQLQTGQVYPNSDLYSLAATCLVLLTGKEPRSLVDSQTLEWRWQNHTTMSEDLARILNRMLSVYPSDRYPSAQDVYQDLGLLPQDHHTQIQLNYTRPVTQSVQNLSLASTLLNPNQPVGAISNSRTATKPRKAKGQVQSYRFSQLGRRLRFGMAIAGVLGTVVAGSWLWFRWVRLPTQTSEVWVSGAKLPQSEASKIIGAQGVPTDNSLLTAPFSPELRQRDVAVTANSSQLIEFPPGQVATTLAGNLQNNGLQSYRLEAVRGQILTTTLNGAGVVMNVLRSNQEGIDAAAYQTRSWTGQLPDDGQYLIQVSGSGSYTLDVAITPTSRPTKERTDRINFARGTNGTVVTGTLFPQQIRRYLLKANRGQLVLVKVIQGNVDFSAIAPDGQRLGSSTPTTKKWKGQLPMAGDYVIEVSTNQPGNYALSFEIF